MKTFEIEISFKRGAGYGLIYLNATANTEREACEIAECEAREILRGVTDIGVNGALQEYT
jgi:hypothetical protein